MKHLIFSFIFLFCVGCSPLMQGFTGGVAAGSTLNESDLPAESNVSGDMIDNILGMAEVGAAAAGIPLIPMLIGFFRNKRKWSALNADRELHKQQTANIQPTHVVNVYVNGDKVEAEDASV